MVFGMKLKKIVSIYAIVNLVFLSAVIPIHLYTVKTAKKIVYAETKNVCINSMSKLDSELKNMNSVGRIIEGDSNYGVLKKNRGELSSAGHNYLFELYSEYSTYVSMNSYIRDAVFLFENNSIIMMKDYCFADAKFGFDSFFRFGNMSYEELKSYVFYDKSCIGKFVYDKEMYYNGETIPAVVYFMPVGENSRTGEYSCMMLILTIEDFLNSVSLKDFEDDIDFFVRTTDGEVCLGDSEDINENTIVYHFGMNNTVFGINLNNSYYIRKEPYLKFIWFYYIFVFAGTIILSAIMIEMYRKPLVKLIKMLQNTNHEKMDIVIGGEFEIASELITKEKNRNIAADNLVLENYILNFFCNALIGKPA